MNFSISEHIFFNWALVVLYSNPIIQSILLCVISVILVTGFSANWEFGMKHNDLSNFLIVVDLKPIRSTEPSQDHL